MERFRAAVLTHDDGLYAAIPKHEALIPVDLRDLGLPADIAGNELAESRFLLADAADRLSDRAEYVGVLPARWDERFPLWPPLADIDLVEPWLGPGILLAPSASPLPVRLVDDWIAMQDQVHPGMAAVLWDLPRRERVGSIGAPVWGNTFVVHRTVYSDLVAFFREAFDEIHGRHGFDLPYSYRCPRCGHQSAHGVGRWRDDRHASYFYERVTSVYFAARGDLTVLDHQGRPRGAKPQERAFARLPAPARRRVISGLVRRTRRHAPCRGTNGAACA